MCFPMTYDSYGMHKERKTLDFRCKIFADSSFIEDSDSTCLLHILKLNPQNFQINICIPKY